MNLNDLIDDIEEYKELGDMAYSKALEELAYYISHETRPEAKEIQDKLNKDYPDYPKVNVL